MHVTELLLFFSSSHHLSKYDSSLVNFVWLYEWEHLVTDKYKDAENDTLNFHCGPWLACHWLYQVKKLLKQWPLCSYWPNFTPQLADFVMQDSEMSNFGVPSSVTREKQETHIQSLTCVIFF